MICHTQPLHRYLLCCYDIVEYLKLTNIYSDEQIDKLVTISVQAMFTYHIELDCRYSTSGNVPLHSFLVGKVSEIMGDSELQDITLAYMLFVCASLEHRLQNVIEILTPFSVTLIRLKNSDLEIVYDIP